MPIERLFHVLPCLDPHTGQQRNDLTEPRDLMYSISRYLNIQQAYFPCFAPDGQHIAFLSNITGTPQVWRVALALQPGQVLWPDQLTFEADRVLGVWYSPVDAGQLLYARDVGGNENAQLFLLRTDGAEEIPLTQGYENAMHIFGEWSEDGKHILFAANRRHPGLFDLYLQPLGGEARMVDRKSTRLNSSHA